MRKKPRLTPLYVPMRKNGAIVPHRACGSEGEALFILDTDKTIERVEIYLAASRVRELFGLLTDIKTEAEMVEMFSTFVERLEKLLNER